MKLSLSSTTILNNGVKMPLLGFGVFMVPDGDELENAVRLALEAGYRNIDTASAYQNEKGVGNALKTSGIPREEVFISTKIWTQDQGYYNTLNAFEKSLELLQVDYLDLYLIHWPAPQYGQYVETWKAMVELYEKGLIKAIGVSNFTEEHINNIVQETGVMPTVNQVECHPWMQQKEMLDFCMSNNIQMEGYSPLIRGKISEINSVKKLAEKYGKTPAQIVLRWHLQNNIAVIPKSTTPSRIIENTRLYDFQLTNSEMEELDSLNRGQREFPAPDEMNYWGPPGN